jgi:hypothetical protein
MIKDSILFAGAVIGGVSAGDALENHGVSLGTVFSVAGIVLPAVWWMSRKFTNLDDRLQSMETKIEKLEGNK